MSTSGASHYFYYQDRKTELGPILTDMLIIGFEPGIGNAEKEKIMADFEFLDKIVSVSNSGSADVTVVNTKGEITPGTLEVKFSVLEQHPQIIYASPFFGPVGGAPGRVGITNQFIITLEDKVGEALLEKLMARTQTRKVDTLGPHTFVLSADKNSAGNALDMANYFHESPGIKIGEPDFMQNLVLDKF